MAPVPGGTTMLHGIGERMTVIIDEASFQVRRWFPKEFIIQHRAFRWHDHSLGVNHFSLVRHEVRR